MFTKNSTSKLLTCLFLIASTFSTSFAQETDGVQFFEGSWEEALATAKKQNKAIFLDGYTSWCSMCKKMTKTTFTEKKVGDFYNTNFINVKLDMEKEGLELANKYNVRHFPTYLFFDANGQAVHRSVGWQPTDRMLKTGRSATDESRQFYTLQRAYKSTKTSKEVMYNYALAAAELGMYEEATKASDSYFTTQKKKKYLASDNMDLVMSVAVDTEGKAFQIMDDNYKKFVKKYGKNKVHGMYNYAMSNKVARAAETGDEKSFKEAIGFVNKHFGEVAKENVTRLSLDYYQKTGNWKATAKLANDLVKENEESNWQSLNEIAWAFYENVTDKELLASATDWAKKSIELNKNYYNTDTYAALLYKQGKNKEALAAAKVAIEQAELEGIDAVETQELLKKLESM